MSAPQAPSPLVPLLALQHRVRLGAPLPFAICLPDGRLLLAKGQAIADDAQLQALLDRGALIDRSEADASKRDLRQLPAEQLPEAWRDALDQLHRMLRASLHQAFVDALDECAAPLIALVDRDPDLAIFQILRQELCPRAAYGSAHGAHVAMTLLLVTRRLGASPDEQRRAVRAALTMNLAAVELMSRLAGQELPLRPPQQQALREHPLRSALMLQERGVVDADWLRAVAEHHERDDGMGYPRGLRTPSPLAQLLGCADVYTAKLSARAGRHPVAADRAVRDVFMSRKERPEAAAILKEFGVFPPGTLVQLASGERGVVIRRGAAAQTPLVAALINRSGEPLMQPLRRDTAQAGNAVTAVLPAAEWRLPLKPEALIALAGAPPIRS